ARARSSSTFENCGGSSSGSVGTVSRSSRLTKRGDRAVGAGSAGSRAVRNGVLALALLALAAKGSAQSALGNGQLQIIGTGLDISPDAQTVPLGVPPRVITTRRRVPRTALAP